MAFNPLNYPMMLKQPKLLSGGSMWVEHIPLGFALIEMLKPATVVELGVSRGDSYCAFCQAVDELQLPTRCYGIDTFQGDPHEGFYTAEVLANLKTYHDPLYSKFSTIIESSFDAALPRFPDHSIDLLHLDGLPTHDASRNDFSKWLPKMSDRGVMLIHDTQTRDDDAGVWKLWEEVSPDFPHLNLPHGYGLGILAVGKNPPAELIDLIADAAIRPAIAQMFYMLGLQVELRSLTGVVLSQVFRHQILLNEWKQQTGAQIDPTTQDPQAIFRAPVQFTQNLMRDIHALAIENLKLRHHLAQNLSPDTPPPPAEPQPDVT